MIDRGGQAQAEVSTKMSKEMRKVTLISQVEGNSRRYGSSLRQSTSCFLAAFVAVIACQHSVSSQRAS